MIYSKNYVKKKKDKITTSIIFVQHILDASISIDSENMSRKMVDINGWKGQMNYKKNKKSIIWATNEYAFTVHGNGKVTEEELLKVARSVSIIE